jgi:LysR family transcriptional regulator, low CO2-responsive transcriptional regulator
MTLAQLQSFVLVARFGSVKAAAAELRVTEPAVSVAVSALRKELGDELFVREGRGIALTAGGRRLAALAGEILALAEQARRSVPQSGGPLQVVATGVAAAHVGPLLDAFTAREDGVEVALGTVPGGAFAEALEQRRADIALGPHPGPVTTIASAPFLRCRFVVAAAPGHRLAGAGTIAPGELARERWLAGPLDPTTGTGRFLARHGLSPAVTACASGAEALAAAAAGEGIVLAVAHEAHRRGLVRLDVRGTPVVELWHASTLGLGRALPAALALQRFATTPEATQAISTGRTGGVARRNVHVTLWRGLADPTQRTG